ncbi:MAG: signal peptidase I [Bacillota bacterium]
MESKKEKQPMSAKKVLLDISKVLQILFIVVTMTISIVTVAAMTTTDTVENFVFGTKLMPVASNSMEGDNEDSFSAGDLLITKEPEEGQTFEVGDIITFYAIIDGTKSLNTHRIVDVIVYDSGAIYYETKGDNNLIADTTLVAEGDIVAYYSNHIANLGTPILWLQNNPTAFFLIIIVPLILLLLVNASYLIWYIIKIKVKKVENASELEKENIKKLAIEEFKAMQLKEEEIKRQAIEDYKKEQESLAIDADTNTDSATENSGVTDTNTDS